VEIARRRFLPDVKVQKIDIGTVSLPALDGGNTSTNVSTIEIILKR